MRGGVVEDYLSRGREGEGWIWKGNGKDAGLGFRFAPRPPMPAPPVSPFAAPDYLLFTPSFHADPTPISPPPSPPPVPTLRTTPMTRTNLGTSTLPVRWTSLPDPRDLRTSTHSPTALGFSVATPPFLSVTPKRASHCTLSQTLRRISVPPLIHVSATRCGRSARKWFIGLTIPAISARAQSPPSSTGPSLASCVGNTAA